MSDRKRADQLHRDWHEAQLTEVGYWQILLLINKHIIELIY